MTMIWDKINPKLAEILKFFRPSMIRYWNKQEDLFSRYRSIILEGNWPKSDICKEFSVDFQKTNTLDELIQKHKRYSLLFRENLADSSILKNEKGEENFLDLKLTIAHQLLKDCILCERRCKVNRYNQTGYCGLKATAIVQGLKIHIGLEPPMIPGGNIFLFGCNFRCDFCRNYHSWSIDEKKPKLTDNFGIYINRLIKNGAININFDGGEASLNLNSIIQALKKNNNNASNYNNTDDNKHHNHNHHNVHNYTNHKPIILSTNFYLTPIALEILRDIVDVWLIDFKFGNDACAREIAEIENYWKIITRNLKVIKNDNEIVVRHLILPGHLECCSKPIMDWIAKNLPNSIPIHLMGQYRPFRKSKRTELNKKISHKDINEIQEYATELGINWKSVSGYHLVKYTKEDLNCP